MATAQQTIDAYLGDGWYDEWRDMDEQEKSEKRELAEIEARLGSLVNGHHHDVWFDARNLERIGADYDRGMAAIVKGKAVDKTKIDQVHDLYTLALGVVEHEREALGALVATGFVVAFAGFPFVVYAARAKELREILKLLEAELEKAKSERLGAAAQTLVNAAVLAIELAVPHLSLVSRGALFIAQAAVNSALGPKKPAELKAAGKGTHAVALFSHSVGEIERLGQRTQTVITASGKPAAVVGFFFDGAEIGAAHANVGQIEAAMAKAKKAHDKLIKTSQKYKPALAKLKMTFDRAMVSIKSTLEDARQIRYQLEKDVRAYAYSVERGTAW